MKNKYVKHAHISEVVFRKVLKMFCADIPALTTGGLTGLSVQGAPQLYDGLRLRILELTLAEAQPFAGEVEIDESYFGRRRVRGQRGRGAGGKTPVIGLLKRGGKVFTEIVENCSKQGGLITSLTTKNGQSGRIAGRKLTLGHPFLWMQNN